MNIIQLILNSNQPCLEKKMGLYPMLASIVVVQLRLAIKGLTTFRTSDGALTSLWH